MAITARQSNEDEPEKNVPVEAGKAPNDNVEDIKTEDGTIKIKLNIPTLDIPIDISAVTKNTETNNQPERNSSVADISTPTPGNKEPNKIPTPSTNQEQVTPPAEQPTSKDSRPVPEQTAPQQSANPPAVSNDNLGQTGPHPTSDKTPGVVPPGAENTAASNLAASKSFGGRMRDNAANKIQGAKQAIKDAPKNAVNNIKNAPRKIINNITNNLQSDRNRKKQLGQQRRKLESELEKLENKVDGVKGSRAMQLIRFWFPGIYAAISGFGAGMANAKGQAKVAMLQSKLLTAQTIKGTLKTAEGVSALIEANIKVISWIAESIETVIIPILLILIYPILILILWIFIEFMGALGAPITKSIKELGKQVDDIIENLKKVLEPENKKIKVRKEIQMVNRLMAATKQDRKNHLDEQKAREAEKAAN